MINEKIYILFVFVSRPDGVYTIQYVKNFISMVKTNLKKEHEIIGISNEDISEYCTWVPAKFDLPGKWCKMELYRNDLPIEKHAKVLFIDLDVVILKKLNPFFELWLSTNHMYAAQTNYTKSIETLTFEGRIKVCCSAVLLFRYGASIMRDILKEFNSKPQYYMDRLVGDQDFLGYMNPGISIFPAGMVKKLKAKRKRHAHKPNAIISLLTNIKPHILKKRFRWVNKTWKVKRNCIQNKKEMNELKHELTVVTWLWGDWYGLGDMYLVNLYNSLKRNLSRDFKFVVITDRIKLPVPGRIIQLNPPSKKRNLAKLQLFDPANNFESKRILAIDLDMVIFRNIDFVFEYKGELCLRGEFKNYNEPDGDIQLFQDCSVWPKVWKVLKNKKHIRQIEQVTMGNERWFYSRFGYLFWKKIDIWQYKYPGSLVSYKKEFKNETKTKQNELLQTISMMTFHGKPKPHSLTNLKMIKDNWK